MICTRVEIIVEKNVLKQKCPFTRSKKRDLAVFKDKNKRHKFITSIWSAECVWAVFPCCHPLSRKHLLSLYFTLFPPTGNQDCRVFIFHIHPTLLSGHNRHTSQQDKNTPNCVCTKHITYTATSHYYHPTPLTASSRLRYYATVNYWSSHLFIPTCQSGINVCMLQFHTQNKQAQTCQESITCHYVKVNSNAKLFFI